MMLRCFAGTLHHPISKLCNNPILIVLLNTIQRS